MKQKILKILSKVLNVPLDGLNEKSSIESIEEWDSLKHINLILALEEEFGVKFSETEVTESLNVDAIFKTLSGKLPQAQ